MGFIFFINPYLYAELEGANFENIAWLRNLGAALISVNGIGALLASSNPIKEKKLYDVVLLASCLETIALSWSTYSWEFSATVPWLIVVPLLMASLVSILLLIFSRFFIFQLEHELFIFANYPTKKSKFL